MPDILNSSYRKKVPVGDLIQHPRNPNRGDDAAIRESIEHNGFYGALMVQKSTNFVLAGNHRLRAAIELGYKEVPCVFVDVDDDRAMKLLLADNRIGQLAQPDERELLAILDQMATPDLEGTGYTEVDVQKLMSLVAAQDKASADEPDAVDPSEALREKWKTERGQLWQIGSHRLMIGDSTDADGVARLLDGAKITTVISDPPYGVNFDTDYTRFTEPGGTKQRLGEFGSTNHKKIHGDGAAFDPAVWLGYKHVVLWGANCYSDKLPLGAWLIWDKRFENGKALLSDAEVAWKKGGHGVHIKSVTSQGFVRPEKVQHPTQKPVSIMAWCIEKSGSKAPAIIYDPFLGSGTTMVAAEQLGRKCYGIEIEPRYAAVVLERMSSMGLKPELAK